MSQDVVDLLVEHLAGQAERRECCVRIKPPGRSSASKITHS